jgi:heparin binding hemagglutinin HbhA
MSQPEDKNSGPQPQGDLASELRELGQQLEQAVRTAIESERAKQLQSDISSGMKEIGAQMQSALKAIQEDERVKHLAERGQQAIGQAQHSQVAKDFQEALTRGISQLNDQLSAFVTRLQSNSGEAGTGSTPGASSTPSTGETTRLDDEK